VEANVNVAIGGSKRYVQQFNNDYNNIACNTGEYSV
jgi:hypothetical protein